MMSVLNLCSTLTEANSKPHIMIKMAQMLSGGTFSVKQSGRTVHQEWCLQSHNPQSGCEGRNRIWQWAALTDSDTQPCTGSTSLAMPDTEGINGQRLANITTILPLGKADVL